VDRCWDSLDEVDEEGLHEEHTHIHTCCNFVVLGSTGNVYTVSLQEIPSCTCPDFTRQQDLCKHILFVLVKVAGVSTSNPLAYQKAYVPSELQELFQIVRQRRVGGGVVDVEANERVRQCYKAAHGRGHVGGCKTEEGDVSNENETTGVKRRSLLEDNNDCPICFDEMESLADTVYCRTACGANFHKDCIHRWLSQPAQRQNATCPNCRQSWADDNDGGLSGKRDAARGAPMKRDEEYENLGALQGQSSIRDTSTYQSRFSPDTRYKRRRSQY
jgi:hypothetical protein